MFVDARRRRLAAYRDGEDHDGPFPKISRSKTLSSLFFLRFTRSATNFHYRYLSGGERLNSAEFGDQFEFDKADLWSPDDIINVPKTKQSISNPRPMIRKPPRKAVNADRFSIGAKSLPVNIPDWSKILRGECLKRAGDCNDNEEEDDDDDGNNRLPPHEYLARTRGASFSVHEGVSRTLKGRDLSRVRDTIWK